MDSLIDSDALFQKTGIIPKYDLDLITAKSERGILAQHYFMSGYNCTQAVVAAFSDILPNEYRGMLLRIAAPFGGGMGRLREVCGSVSGMFIVAGALYGYDTPETGEKKAELYRKIQDLADSFRKESGSIVCKELLGQTGNDNNSYIPSERTAEYYKKRPCKECVGRSADILSEYIKSNK